MLFVEEESVGFLTSTRHLLGINLQLGGGRGGKVELKKGKNWPKSHRVENLGSKSWEWKFEFSLFKQGYLNKGVSVLEPVRGIGMSQLLFERVKLGT